MKKKQRCFCKRFAALVAAFMMAFALAVPAFASSNVTADMPSYSDFQSRPGSWFVWRSINDYYELICGPLSFADDGYLNISGSATATYSNTLSDFSYISDSSGSRYSFACAVPLSPSYHYGTWASLPSFPVGSSATQYFANLRFYPVTGSDLDSVYAFVCPLYGAADKTLVFSNSDSGSVDSFDVASFDNPFLQYPFASRSYDTSSNQGYQLTGGSSSFCNYSNSSSHSAGRLNLSSSYYILGSSSLTPYPPRYSIPSSDLGVVFVKKPSPSYTVVSSSDFSVSVRGQFTLMVPALLLDGVEVGTWISSEDLEKLQDQLVSDFDVDSGTLKNSKDNLNSWNSTSSVDSDVAAGASGLLNAVFQNLGTFLFSVSLLCFGAVVLRMLIKKAVDG